MLACFCAKTGTLQVPSTKLDISNGKGILMPECVTIRFCSVVEMIFPKSGILGLCMLGILRRLILGILRRNMWQLSYGTILVIGLIPKPRTKY